MKSLTDLPRFRGRVGQADEPEEVKGKWFCELEMTNFQGTQRVGPPFGPFGPYETEAEAQAKLRDIARLACETVEKRLDGEASGHYMDLKNGGIMRKWDEN